MPSLLALGLFATVTAAEPQLGTALRQEGVSLRPPQGFLTVRKELYLASRVGAVSVVEGAPRSLLAALVDGPGEDAASMVIALVEGSFQPSPSARDELATATVRHFGDELGITLALERAELVEGSVPRVEVLGTIKREGQIRHVLVAALGAEGRHPVVTFSVPSGRYQALEPVLHASLDSFRVETPAAPGLPRTVLGALAGALAGALVVSVALWRRRHAARQEAALDSGVRESACSDAGPGRSISPGSEASS